MKHNWNSILGVLFFLTAVPLVQSCEEPCDEPPVEEINALYFELKRGGEDGFNNEQLSQISIARFYPFTDTIISDTFFLGNAYPEEFGKFFINNNFPFTNESAPYYTFYRYEIFTDDFTTIHLVDSIDLAGEYTGECNYQNLSKSFQLNEQVIDVSGSMEHVLLTKQ